MTASTLTWRPATSEEIWHQFPFCFLGADWSQMTLKREITLSTEIEEMFNKLIIGDFYQHPIFDYWSVSRPSFEQDEQIKTVKDLCDYIAQSAKTLILPAPSNENGNAIFLTLKQLLLENQTDTIEMPIKPELKLDQLDCNVLYKVLSIIHRSLQIQGNFGIEARYSYTSTGKVLLLILPCLLLFGLSLLFIQSGWKRYALIGFILFISMCIGLSIHTELKSVTINNVETLGDLVHIIEAQIQAREKK